MSLSKRVFITGTGALTASGATVDANWDALMQGQSHLSEIKQWDLSSWSHRLGGEIQAYEPAQLLPDRKLMKVISRQDVLGINAALQAVQDSQWLAYRNTLTSPDDFNERTAVFVGSPGNKYYQQYDFLPLMAKTKGSMKAFAEQLFREVHPMWLLRILPNNVLAYTGITYGFKGINHNITNHAVSGTQALIEAYHAIQQGQADRAVVVGYDVGTEPQALYYYEKLGVISTRHLKPFDADHDGTLLAEGAAAIVLESEDSVAARGGISYAEIIGGASTTEAKGLFSIEADGSQLAHLMTSVLQQQQIDSDQVGVVVAHGNGNPKSDISEAKAIQQVFSDHTVPVTAFKWSMGHTLCASGLLDTVLMTRAFQEQSIPGVASLNGVAEDCCPLDLSAQTRPMDVNQPYALILNRGFSSMNACVAIKRCE